MNTQVEVFNFIAPRTVSVFQEFQITIDYFNTSTTGSVTSDAYLWIDDILIEVQQKTFPPRTTGTYVFTTYLKTPGKHKIYLLGTTAYILVLDTPILEKFSPKPIEATKDVESIVGTTKIKTLYVLTAIVVIVAAYFLLKK